MQIKLVTKCNKNEQQQDTKNNAELQAEWRKRLGRPLKSLLDEAGTGLLIPNS
jgi:hypothetical protein